MFLLVHLAMLIIHYYYFNYCIQNEEAHVFLLNADLLMSAQVLCIVRCRNMLCNKTLCIP